VVLKPDVGNPLELALRTTLEDFVFGAFAIHLQQINGFQMMVCEYVLQGRAIDDLITPAIWQDVK
jgi:hypothetical protein